MRRNVYGLKPVPSWFRDAIASFTESLKYFESDKNTEAHVKSYMTHLADGDYVAVVAHSQGNLYMQSAFHILESQGFKANYGSVMVATPLQSAPIGEIPSFSEDAQDRGDGDYYTTLKSDLVISHLPSSLSANTQNSKRGFIDHFFVDAYLAGDVSGPKILKQIACLLSHMYQGIKVGTLDPVNPKVGEGYWDPYYDACQSVSGH